MTIDGVINLDKPPGLSSARVVAAIKRLAGRDCKVGHAGTLDPFATGVLVILLGKSTRLCERIMHQPKQYEATIKLGATTETLDPDSPEIVTAGAAPVDRKKIEAALMLFLGEIDQLPPIYSALKIAGQPAYQRARRGEDVKVQARKVRIDSIELLRYRWPFVAIRIDCGRGTYIRSIARDLGTALGMGGYLTQLRRTRVGPFRIENAVTLERLSAEGIAGHLADFKTEQDKPG